VEQKTVDQRKKSIDKRSNIECMIGDCILCLVKKSFIVFFNKYIFPSSCN